MKVLGLMSGSSLDGLDIACVEFDPNDHKDWKFLFGETRSFDPSLAKAMQDILSCDAFGLTEVNSQYSAFLAKAIKSCCAENNMKVDFVAIHGHTLLHSLPHKYSWQLGNGAYIAALSGCPVVTDFRNGDMALGGQGTPMAVIADRDLFPGYDYYINLGGIANVSFEDVLWHAYDICPCNQVLNYFARQRGIPFDKDGAIARSGDINHQLVTALSQEPYILAPPPKSIDNSWIHNYWIPRILEFDDTLENYLCSYTHFIADCIVALFSQASAKTLITGGGAHNSYLIDILREKLASSALVVPESKIVDYKESILTAYMGFLRILQKPNFIPSATGASTETSGGAVYLPPCQT